MDDEYVRNAINQHYRPEFFQRIVGQMSIQAWRYGKADIRHEQRITVRRSFCDYRRADRRAGTGTIIDNEWRTPRVRQFLADGACEDVDAAARRIHDDEAHRFNGVIDRCGNSLSRPHQRKQRNDCGTETSSHFSGSSIMPSQSRLPWLRRHPCILCETPGATAGQTSEHRTARKSARSGIIEIENTSEDLACCKEAGNGLVVGIHHLGFVGDFESAESKSNAASNGVCLERRRIDGLRPVRFWHDETNRAFPILDVWIERHLFRHRLIELADRLETLRLVDVLQLFDQFFQRIRRDLGYV